MVQFLAQRIVLSELSKVDNGVISYSVSICTAVFGIIVEAGLTSIAIRDIARHPERKEEYLRSLFTLRLFTSVVATVVIGIIAYISYADHIMAMIYASLYMIIAGRTPMLRAVFEVEHRAEIRLSIVSLLSVVDILLYYLLLSFHHSHLQPQDVFLYQFLAAIPGFLILLLVRKGYRHAVIVRNTAAMREMLREARPLMILTLLLYSHIGIDSVALRIFAPPDALGIFGASGNAALIGTIVFGVANAVFGPYLSRSWHQNPEQARHHIIRSLHGVALMLILAAAIAAVLNPWIIEIFTKGKYADNAFEFRLQYWASIIINLLQFGVLIVTSIGRQSQQVRIGLALIIGSLTMDYLLISQFQAAGLVYAKMVGNMLALGVFFAVIRDVLQGRVVAAFMLRLFGLIAIAFAASEITRLNQLSIPLALSIVLCVSIASAFALGYITSFERSLITKILRRKAANNEQAS